MLSTIGLIISVVNGAWTLVKNLFGMGSKGDNTEDAATQAVKMTNESGKITDTATRQAATSTDKGLQDASNQTAASAAAVAAAGSLHDGSNAVNDAIAGANKDPDSNG
jgi:DNA polymerase/3'-5' exonuclease PolX